MRVATSVPPPAPNPTRIWTGLEGQSCARADEDTTAMTAPAEIAAPTHVRFMIILPGAGCQPTHLLLLLFRERARMRRCQRLHLSSSIGLRRIPTPSISISHVSPAFIQTGSGFRA